MRDSDKSWTFVIVVTVLAMLVMLTVATCAGCAGASSKPDAPKSRWWQTEAPRPDLECWETRLSRGYQEGGHLHIECWPKAPR